MSDQKQYYNNTQPGETSLESRTGAKVVMDNKGGIKLSSVRSKAYLDELRKNGLLQTTSQNPDEDSSYMFIGEGNVDINNQGSVNQDSLNITAETENQEANIIEPDRTEIIIASLPTEEPKPSPTPTPSPSYIPLPLDEEVVISDSLPETELSGQEQTFDNTGVNENGTGQEKPLSITERAQILSQLETKNYTAPSGKTYNVVKGGKLTPDAQALLDSCKSTNAVNSAIKMNPTNYGVVNKNLPVFSYNGTMHSVIVAKRVCPPNLFCSAGVITSFIAANGNDKAGGFPLNNSSQVVFNINGVVTLLRNKDYIGTKLTKEGIDKFNSTLGFKGAVFAVTKANGSGHIGMVLGAELSGTQGTLYTLEFNTGAPGGNQRGGGKLAFRKRVIGGSWGFVDLKFSIAPTSQFSGGSWTPNGLSNPNTFEAIGNWKENKTVFK
jgi:hypothetical protein